MKILLLNPPAKHICSRDYYCSKTSKAAFIYPPIDLLILSGRIAQKYPVEILDAVVQRMSFKRCFKKIIQLDINAIIFLTGSISWKNDFNFIQALKKEKNYTVVASGDIFMERADKWLKENEFLDAILLDFSSNDIMHYLEGDYSKIKNMVFRKRGKIITTPIQGAQGIEFELPIPKHELFLGKGYSYPFVKRKPWSIVLTDYGCPYNCSFCIIGTLGFKYRTIPNVIEELNYLFEKGVKEIFFVDQSFGALKRRTQELCSQMLKNNFEFSWFCFSRVDLLDRNTLELMKKSGCHTIIFGVETVNETLLKKYRKGYTKEQIKETFQMCREIGIETVGTFLLGMPDEDEHSCLETIRFAQELDCDYASFNIAVPRLGTELRQEAISCGLVDANLYEMDQAGSFISMPTRKISKKKISKLKRKAIISFYSRPSYLWKRLRKIKSLSEFRTKIREGFGLIKNLYR